MTRTEVITRLCEMAAELAEITQQYQGEPDVKFSLSHLEQCFQTALREMQGGHSD